jgi:hypothetical protein
MMKIKKNWFGILILIALLSNTLLVSAQSTSPSSFQYGRQQAILIDAEGFPVGTAEYWNNRGSLMVEFQVTDGWSVKDAQVYAGAETPPLKKDKPQTGKFPCLRDYPDNPQGALLQCDLSEELGFTWGGERTRFLAFHGDLVQYDAEGTLLAENDFWALPLNDAGEIGAYFSWPGLNHGGYFTTTFYHPQRGHFIDSPVAGLTYQTPTNWGTTDASGGFDYFPGERVHLWVGSVYLGNPLADHKISPMDVFESYDLEDGAVINMARLLQSLDADGVPKGGINISPAVTACLDAAVFDLLIDQVDFSDDFMTQDLINQTLARCAGNPDLNLVNVDAETAKANLADSLDSSMFRKNVARTPWLSSSKSKLNIMGVWFPALKADGTENPVEYYDENGNLIRTAYEAKPIVVTYTDGVPETGYEDIFAAISRDDGNTFKRTNLSRAADRTSFTLANGIPYFGEAKKPVFQVKGNNILVAWTSKYCNGGKPAYAIDLEDDYTYDDPYYTEDIWGVGGPQRSHDYTEDGYPDVGEVPYSCVWVARGVIATQKNVDKGLGEFVGDIVWFKPERLTSGRRDANQVFMGGADGAGFAIAWQEDPEGLRPGSAAGPGPGWGGATTSHKTDIWYSYITMTDFAKVDANFVTGGDPQHDLDVIERPKALVPMSLPVRVTDNDVVNSDNIMATSTDFGTWTPVNNPDTDGDGDGTHAYGYAIDGLCEGYYEKVNEQGETKQVCITADNRLLDGDTGASRPNLFLQTYTKQDGTKSAWAIFAYEETKGVGGGAPDHEPEGGPYGDDYVAESGKNAIYHSFDFQNPDLVSAGNIINLPEKEVDDDGNIISNISYIKDEEGSLILDWLGQPQINYENARRPRFILQGKSAAGGTGTVLLVLYKEGQEGMGRPSDIMLRRVVSLTPGNPYAFKNFICNFTEVADNGVEVCVDGAQNMSSVTPTVTTDSMGDPEVEDPYGAVKVVEWAQTVENLADLSSTNPYDDARAHRGQIRGDFVVMGFSYTANWAAARNGNDKYDFYVRRSFDGGQTWTTDPAGSGVTHCNTWTYPSGTESPGTKVEVCNTYPASAFEQMRNLSQLPNNKTSVIEPRIVSTPGTIKVDGVWTGIAEDKQNPNVFYVSYGTSTNPKKDPVTGEQDAPHPLDLFYSFSLDKGESYVEVAWDVNPDSDGNYAGETVYRWDYLAKGDPEQGEAQLRMTPDGSRFYATWLQEGADGSDIWFRRIMSPAFPVNVAQ